MGITIVQKSGLGPECAKGKRALILAGGAVTGGSFMAGGLKALSDYIESKGTSDFDMFVGISAGSMLAAPLMAGISPESILRSLDGTSSHFAPLRAWHYYRPNLSEFFSKPMFFAARAALMFSRKLIGVASRHDGISTGLVRRVIDFLVTPSVASYDKMVAPLIDMIDVDGFPSLSELLPSGLFDNSAIESYIRKNIALNGLTNDFAEAKKMTGKSLYIPALRLDDSKRVVFGADEDKSATISEAIWASTAMPGFYKPARLNGVDYVDGGVQQTASIDIAVEKGAKLIVCYNPFRPYEPKDFVDSISKSGRRPISSDGLLAVMNQIFRAFFHSRLKVAIEHYKKSKDFGGDIILIEPRAEDKAFFALNPLFLRNKVEAAVIGFESVRDSIDRKFDEMNEIMSAYGMKLTRDRVEREFTEMNTNISNDKMLRRLLEGSGKRAFKLSKGRAKIKRTVKRVRNKGKRAKVKT